MSSERLISVHALSKCYRIYDEPHHRLLQMICRGRKNFYREFWALKDVNFNLFRGESVGIIGRNGAGKSTLLQIISGILEPTGGTVWRKSGLKIAALLELGSGFNPEFTGRENVFLCAAIGGLSKTEIERKYKEIIDFADIGSFIDQPVKNYSSGMKVRLAFSVNIAIKPDIMIVDEALAVGDAAFQRKCYARMESLQAEGMTLLFVSHSTGSVKQFCQKCLYLQNGRPIAFGDASLVVARYLQDIFPRVNPQKERSLQQNSDAKENAGVCSWRPGYSCSSCKPTFFGVGGARVDVINVMGIRNAHDFPPLGTKVCVEMKLSWDCASVSRAAAQEGVHPILYAGFHFANVKNVNIFGGNTYSQKIRIDYADMKSVWLRFEFEMPCLAAGNYFLGAAVSLGEPFQGRAVHLWWGDGLLMFRSENEVHGGVIAIDMKCSKGVCQ